jgi:hypothetical protein
MRPVKELNIYVHLKAGLPDGIPVFKPKSQFGKFWSVLQLKMSVNVMANLSILLTFGFFVCHGAFICT